MTARLLSLLLAFALLLTLAAGCSPGATQPAEPDSVGITEPSGGDSAPDGGSEAGDSGASAAPAPLPLSTDGERAALSVAQSDESRRWASGDSVNGTPVTGEPFMVGYGVLLHDGATQYQVLVIGGEVVGAFGRSADLRYIEAPFADFNPTTDPASAQQSAAFDAAKAQIASINPNATQGGIEYYSFFYPPLDDVQYPQVAIYTDPELAEFPHAMGGAYGWR